MLPYFLSRIDTVTLTGASYIMGPVSTNCCLFSQTQFLLVQFRNRLMRCGAYFDYGGLSWDLSSSRRITRWLTANRLFSKADLNDTLRSWSLRPEHQPPLPTWRCKMLEIRRMRKVRSGKESISNTKLSSLLCATLALSHSGSGSIFGFVLSYHSFYYEVFTCFCSLAAACYVLWQPCHDFSWTASA